MGTDIEKMLQQVHSLSELLKSKGWDGAFLTNAAYPDEVGKSLEKYLYQSMLGNEKGIAQGLLLSTYASYVENSKVTCDFTISLAGENSLRIAAIELRQLDSYGQQISRKNIEILRSDQVPTKIEAIAKVIEGTQKKTAHRKGIGL